MDLSRTRTRERLDPRREPYWQQLAKGAHLGFRAGPGTWIAKYRDRTGKRHHRQLGEAIEFEEAKERAEAWFAQMGAPVRSVKRSTVRSALEAYIADLKRHGRTDAAKDALGRFKLTVYEDVLADVPLEAATQDDFLDWRDRLQKGRQARSVNRQVRAVVAGLNRARKLGHIGNPESWTLTPLSDDVEAEEGSTIVFLDPSQRTALIASTEAQAADFFRGLEVTGARPRELAAATAGDFDGQTLKLSHRKGRPPKLRVRQVVLDEAGVAFFNSVAKNKLPKAPLFTEDGKQPWRRHMWAKRMRAAIEQHNVKAKKRLPEGLGAYLFRHARISELLQVYGVDPVTVASQCGTSLDVIQKFYWRFIPHALREKLAALSSK